MKRVRQLTMGSISVALLMGLLIFSTTVIGGPRCDRVTGTGHTFATGPGTFQGTADVLIGGQTQTAQVTTNLLGPPRETEDGTLHAATSHTFSFTGGTITTFDRAVLSPTGTPGVYNLNTRAEIALGTGEFDSACGSLSIHGTINLITGEVVWRFTGQLCSCGSTTEP